MTQIVARMALLLCLFVPSVAISIPQPIGPHGEPPAPKPLHSFWVGNDSGQVMTALYVVHPESDTWGPNILEGKTLGPNEKIKLVRNDDRSDCIYSFEAVFENKKAYDQEEVNICTSEGIMFHSDQ